MPGLTTPAVIGANLTGSNLTGSVLKECSLSGQTCWAFMRGSSTDWASTYLASLHWSVLIGPVLIGA
ncbi:pentapeptide repeat-containing protein, partial [Paracoccus sp. (in: a-proteobacteria)]|uniref:pentapeptide repeat-containing protein n=1 Tax=Paracoccus sp. TaxID=267 RepID=UPI0039175EC2